MSSEPAWLKRFAERVCDAIAFPEVGVPIGCHFHRAAESWEVSLFVSDTEVVGGPQDGVRLSAPFVVDVQKVLAVWDAVDDVSWQAEYVDPEDDLGTHLAVRGVYEGEPVWLRLLARTPEQFSPGRVLNHHTGEVSAAW